MVIILDIVHRGIVLTAKVHFKTPSSEQFTLIHWKDFRKLLLLTEESFSSGKKKSYTHKQKSEKESKRNFHPKVTYLLAYEYRL
jgi:hypothetical protein